MQRHKKLSARILSMALTVAMVATMMPATVFAAEGDVPLGASSLGTSSIGTIQSFDKLEDRFEPSTGEGASKDVYALNVELNTPFEDLNLPDELTGVVARTTTVSAPAEDEPVVDSGKPFEPAVDETIPDEDTVVDGDTATDETVSDNQPATPSDAEEEVKEEIKDEDVPLAPEPEQNEETLATTVEQETIPVTWQSDKEYQPGENGQFIYTAVLPEGYILADGVKLPQIYVAVGRQARAARTSTDVGTVAELMNAVANASGDTTIKLVNSIVLVSGGVNIPTDKTITLDLNGKALTAPVDLIIVKGNANFTVTDSSVAKDGVLKCTRTSNGVAILNEASGNVTVSGGTVEASGAAIVNDGTGNTTVSGGTIKGAFAITNSRTGTGSITVSGGGLEATIFAINNIGTGSVTVSGGKVEGALIAINNVRTGKITISGTAVVTSSNTSSENGTIHLAEVPTNAPLTVLDIQGGTVENTANPVQYAVYFAPSNVTSATLSQYYTKAESATVTGKIKPEAVATAAITIGTQPTTPAAMTYGSITGRLTVAGTASNSNPVSYQWYKNTTNSATGGTAITGATSASFTIPPTLDAGTHYYYCILSATDCPDKASNVATVTVNKANATDAMKTVAATVSKNGAIGATAALPAKPAAATYGTITYGGTITCSNATVNGDTLTYTAPASTAGDTGTITIPVTTATNYNDYNIVVTITSTDKKAATITAFVADKTYNGVAVTQPTPTAVEKDTTTPVTLTYTYKWQKSDESGVYTDISGNTAPKDAGSYKLVIDGSNDTHAGTKEIAFTISKATVTITADNKSAYVGDAKPTLTYTATGLASGDTLATIPTLTYESEPDMSKAGSVKIKASGAVVPNTDNYGSAITYVDGTLTISNKSSGGGSSSSQTIYTSVPPQYNGGTKIIGNVRVPDYTVEGAWKKNANGTWNFSGKDGKAYANSWAPVFNPYAEVTKGQNAFDWFKFDASGNMITGWHTDTDGNTYYLNPNSDNTLGAMKTGWVLIDGKYYYFNEMPDGTRGKLFRNTRTPDGYLVDENGVWDGIKKQ